VIVGVKLGVTLIVGVIDIAGEFEGVPEGFVDGETDIDAEVVGVGNVDGVNAPQLETIVGLKPD